MKLLYISVHEILEYDELLLFTELGYECFSLGGAYMDPRGHSILRRPGIPNMEYNEELVKTATTFPRTEIPEDFLDLFDVIVVMHSPDVIIQNWKKFKNRKVVWRSIGQSTPEVERQLSKFKDDGLKIVRYSPSEKRIPGYIGEDAMIRFYKDPEAYSNWNGTDLKVINFTQTLKGRRNFCGYDMLMKVGMGFPFKVYGPGNEDLGEFNGGLLPYEFMNGQLRDARVYLYGGTWPACYTLSFMEAWMTGIPVVSVGSATWRHKDHPQMNIFEVPELIEDGVNGFVSDNPEMLKLRISQLLNDYELAFKIGNSGREAAIKYFGKNTIKDQWKSFFDTL